ncbi:MAG: CapA family protein [Spirochaetaceae bacterium]|jgi:poly-gamma-glutamate synthesis protein (capsule biosynthesis protein)|nr:CapA family protein [Spirochaetaceae bacterium]
MPLFRHLRFFVLVLLLASCATGAGRKNTKPPAANAASNSASNAPANAASKAASNRLTIAAVGDNLIHIEIINDAKTKTGWNFDPIYTEVKPLIQSADVAFINQETLIAGDKFKLSGYPDFNGPPEIGDALVRAGFNVVNHATNHAMDKGAAALESVIDYWNKYPGVLPLGVHKSAELRANRIALIEKKNIKIGWLAYTYGTNGIPLPKDKPFLVSIIDTQTMAAEIDRLRPLCDFLIVSMHWGEEYQHTPTRRQRELAVFLAARKVDLVLGHHPHVIQPVEEIIREDGGRTLVFFSLGNFLSCQKEKARLLGALARITLAKTERTGGAGGSASVQIVDAEIIPVITHYNKEYANFKIYPLEKYTEKLYENHGIKNHEKIEYNYFSNLHNGIFKTFIEKHK